MVGLVLILTGAAVLRVWHVGRESLWADEALTFVIAKWPVGEMLWYPTDETPALYYILHKSLIPDVASAAVARSISVAAGLLSVVAMYALGRLSFGRAGGLLCAALLAVWTIHADYSQEARAYSLLVLLTILSAASLLWWFRLTEPGAPASGRRHWALAAFAVSTTLAFYTHLLAALWIAIALQILVSLTSRLRTKRAMREVGLTLAAMAVLALPGMVRLVRTARTPDGFHWLPQATPLHFAQTVADVLMPSGLWQNAWVRSSAAAPLVGVAITIGLLGTVGAILVWAMRTRRFGRADVPVFAIGAALLALPLIVWLFGYAVRPVFMPRTILVVIPGMILLLAGAATLLPTRRTRYAFALSIGGLYALSTLLQGTTREKENWSGATAYLAASVRPGDALIVCPIWKFPALRHAAPRALPVPAFGAAPKAMLLVEPAFGGNPSWAQSFFESFASAKRRLFADVRPATVSERHLAMAAGTSLWLVESECEPAMRAELDRLGMSGWETRWQSRGATFRDDIAIRRLRLRGPLTLTLQIVGETRRAGRTHP